MKKATLLLFFIATVSFAIAERINADTEIYEEPGKQTIAVLYKGSGVYVAEQKDGWAKIVSVVFASKKGYDEFTLELPRRAKLYDATHQVTGKVYGKLKLPRRYSYPDTSVMFEMVGYIRSSQLDTNWIVESVLARMIDSARSKIGYDELLPVIQKFRFFVPVQDSGFIAFQMDDVPGLEYQNTEERIKLVFYENRLVAIFHKKPFALKSKEAIMVDGRENLIYLRDLSQTEKRTFGNLFLVE